MSEEANTGRRRRILLGITGSVAAVKGPEIALRLARDSGMDVKVILTRGGQNFWEKAKESSTQTFTGFSMEILVE